MRIISGNFKGKKILEPKDKETRPLKDLTKDQVIGWIKTKLGSDEVSKLETSVKEQCIEQRTPTSISTAPTSWTSS